MALAQDALGFTSGGETCYSAVSVSPMEDSPKER